MEDANIVLCDGNCTHGECNSCDEYRAVYAKFHMNHERCTDCHETLGKNAVSCERCWIFCMGDDAGKEGLES